MNHAGPPIGPTELAPGMIGAILPGCAPSPREWLDGVPPRYLRRVTGRETFAWPFAADASAQYIVKRMQGRASLAREFEVLDALARDGFSVPKALAWCEERAGSWAWLRARRSCVVMERIPHAATLRERLAVADPDERRRWSSALLDLVVRLHERGWYHRDLYLQHVVVRAPSELVLLDVGRARREDRPRPRWFVKDLAALLHSTPRAVGPRARLRFLAGYLDRRGIIEQSERRRWLARTLAKERRMSAHEPRAGEDQPWQDR